MKILVASDLSRILIAEDDPVSRIALEGTLQQQGHDVLVASDGHEAWSILQKDNPPQMAILDWMMPGIDGVQLCQQIRQDPSLQSMYIIMLTAKGRREDMLHALEVGADDYIVKPFDADELSARIRVGLRVLELQSRLTERIEQRFQRLIENTTDITMLIDPDGVLHYVSPSVQRILGYASDEVVGRLMFDCVHSEDVLLFRERLTAYLQTPGLPGTTEFRICHADGRWRLLEATCQGFTDEDNQRRVVLNARDITERKRAENELQRQLTHMSLLNQITRSITEMQDLQSIYGVLLARLEADLPADVTCVLSVDSEGHGISVAALGPKSHASANQMGLFQKEQISLADMGMQLCTEGKALLVSDTHLAELPFIRRWAKVGIRSFIAIPLVAGHRSSCILVICRREADSFDPQEEEFLHHLGEQVAIAMHQAHLYQRLQEAYDELRETRQTIMQQERLRALGQMASGIAHDINNTISPIGGYVELLLMREPNLGERARRYLETIQTAADDIVKVVARMREFYRQRDEQEPLLPIDLNQIVEQSVQLTRPRWKDMAQGEGCAIEVQTELEEELPIMWGVESELRKALINLIFNAVDAMPEGGHITLRTRSVGDSVLLEVADTGIGMDEETRQRCLDPFFSTKGEGGTGLGLATVYGMIQRHQAEIEIQSQPGEGTTMRLIFPLLEETTSRRKASSGTPEMLEYGGPILRILCIDDDPLLRELVKAMLEEDGHTVAMADGGESGLVAFRTAAEKDEPFDVIFTDLGMPYVDGREVARAVKRESPDTPVILLTGWGTRLHAEGNIPSQIDVVLSKPPKMNQMRQALARVMRSRDT